MTNEDILQKTLNITLERFAKQSMAYEAEIANLNAQLILMAAQNEEILQNKMINQIDQEIFNETDD